MVQDPDIKIVQEKNGIREYALQSTKAPENEKPLQLIDISRKRTPSQASRPRAFRTIINLIIRYFGGFVKWKN